MKIDRLIGILSILLQKSCVTAPELAERFEVSRKTISRDIDALCRAGIPIVTRQGVNGGISIMENFKLDKTLLTRSEMQDILAGLRGLDSINGTNRYGKLMEKLSAGSSDFIIGNQSVLIDLSSWYKETLSPKIELIRSAIDASREISFRYYSPNGQSDRQIEPYYVIFRWSSWYVWGWCRLRQNFRLFKLNRLDDLKLTERQFQKHAVPLPDLSNERVFPGGIRVKVLFDTDCKWRLVEEFGSSCFVEQPDGRLLFQGDYTSKEDLTVWILTFGDKAELLEPKEFRAELIEKIEKMQKTYSQDAGETHAASSLPKPKNEKENGHAL